jgi:hypothetical protein
LKAVQESEAAKQAKIAEEIQRTRFAELESRLITQAQRMEEINGPKPRPALLYFVCMILIAAAWKGIWMMSNYFDGQIT